MASETNPTTNPSTPEKKQAAANGSVGKPSGAKKKERKLVEVTNDLPDVWEPSNVDEMLEGFYIGAKNIKYRNSHFLTHMIQNEDTGEVLSFSGAIADRKLARIPKGSWVRVTYMGKIRTTNGDAKDYRIETEEHTRLLDETASE